MPRYSVPADSRIFPGLGADGRPVISMYPNLRYVEQGPLLVPDTRLQGLGTLGDFDETFAEVRAKVLAGKQIGRGVIGKQLGTARTALQEFLAARAGFLQTLDEAELLGSVGRLGIGSRESKWLLVGGGLVAGMWLAGNGSGVIDGAKGAVKGTWGLVSKGAGYAKEGVGRAIGWVTSVAQGGNKDKDGKPTGSTSVSISGLSQVFMKANESQVDRTDARGGVTRGGALDQLTAARRERTGMTPGDEAELLDASEGLPMPVLLALAVGGAYVFSQAGE